MKKSFDKYQVVERLGSGGMAEVFLARSVGAEGLEKQLVIKRILPELASNARFVEMFIAEARIAVALNHPNIVQIYDFGKVDGDFYLAMEYVDGWDVGRVMSVSARYPLSVGDAVVVALEVARGLDYAHRRHDPYGQPLHLVHRDISPQNILISRDGSVKIVDFGIAKAATLTEERANVVKGKFGYMSPEQASGLEVDARSDVFSLGVVLFELVCHRPLFRQPTPEQTLSLVKSAVVPDIGHLNPAVPAPLEHVIYKALARRPEDRFQSARELQQALMRVLHTQDEIHDAYTLAEHVSRLDAELEALGRERRGRKTADTTRTDMVRVSVMQTGQLAVSTPGPQARQGTQISTATSLTPITPALSQTPLPGELQVQARERKEVVLIAGALEGLLALRATLGQERWLQVYQECSRVVDSIAFKNDAIVHRLDESGFVLALGLPISSENDAERASRVAIDLQDAMAGINLSLDAPLQLAIGIAMGEVLLEQSAQSSTRHEGRRFAWSFYGASHEFAERLARAGMAREILLGGQVYRRIRRDFHAEAVADARLEAHQGAQCFRLIGPKSPRDRLKEVQSAYRAFYGRELEMKALRATYREVRLGGDARALVLVGAQGVGKSTLVEEFLRGLDPREVRVVRGAVNPFDQDVPLGGMAALVSDLLRLGPREELRQMRSTLEARVQALFPDEPREELELLLHSIGGIFNLRFPGGAFEELGGEERRKRVSLSLRKLLKRFAEKKPVVLAVEDAQEMDAMTREITTQMLSTRQDAPIFLLLTLSWSSATPPPGWEALFAARHVRVERLGDLANAEAEALVRDLLRVSSEDDEALAQEVLRRSGGNPFYMKEVIEIFRDRGALQRGAAALADHDVAHDASWLPASVEALIGARVDRLPLEQKAVIQRAALLWTPFTGADVTQALGVESQSLALLEALVGRGLLERVNDHLGLREETWDPEAAPLEQRAYRFCNVLTQEVAARTLLPEEARQIHAQIVATLRARHGDTPTSVNTLALLARHLDGAGQLEQAAHHYARAAAGALEQFGAAESLRLIERALERAQPDGDAAYEALHLKESLMRPLGMVREHRAVLDRLTRLAELRQDIPAQANLLLCFARYHYDQAEFKRAISALERARSWALANDLPLALARSWHQEASIRLDQGQREEALALVHRAIEGYGHGGESPEAREGLVASYNTLGIILRRTGKLNAALDAYAQASAHIGPGVSGPTARYLRINTGLAMIYAGRFEGGLALYQEALHQSVRLGLRRDEAGVLINIGHAFQVMGDLDRAISHIQRGMHLARRASASTILADGEVSIGVCYAERGETQAASRALSEGLRLAESIPHIYLAVHAMLALARLKLATGEPQDLRVALVQAEDSLERCERAGMLWGVVAARVVMSQVYRAMGRDEIALQLAREAHAEDIETAREEVLWTLAIALPTTPDHDAERAHLLHEAVAILHRQAANLADPEARAAYLDRPLHRRILADAARLSAPASQP